MTWKRLAACRDFPPERIDEVFFYGDKATDEAKDLCATCPVVRDCGDAGRRERWGVWGGRGPKERGIVHSPDESAIELRTNPVYRACVTCGTEFQKETLRQRHCHSECRTNKEKKTA